MVDFPFENPTGYMNESNTTRGAAGPPPAAPRENELIWRLLVPGVV